MTYLVGLIGKFQAAFISDSRVSYDDGTGENDKSIKTCVLFGDTIWGVVGSLNHATYAFCDARDYAENNSDPQDRWKLFLKILGARELTTSSNHKFSFWFCHGGVGDIQALVYRSEWNAN